MLSFTPLLSLTLCQPLILCVSNTVPIHSYLLPHSPSTPHFLCVSQSVSFFLVSVRVSVSLPLTRPVCVSLSHNLSLLLFNLSHTPLFLSLSLSVFVSAPTQPLCLSVSLSLLLCLYPALLHLPLPFSQLLSCVDSSGSVMSRVYRPE